MGGIDDRRGALTEAGPSCGSCGTELPPNSKFCNECGAPVTQVRRPAEFKQVTVLFADVVHSMDIAAAVGAERLREIMTELVDRAAAAVRRCGGTASQFTGDGIMAVFGAPTALEDHALRACIAALQIQSAAKQLAAEVRRSDDVDLKFRVGLNSGEVVAGEIGTSYTAVGHHVGMAQRMEAAAPPGGVLCSQSTARLVERTTRLGPVEVVTVKGSEEPVPAQRLHAVQPAQLTGARDEGPMLGRDADLSELMGLFSARRGCLVGIVGAPGVGKSRLIREFAGTAASLGADVVVARCESHTTGVAFHALSKMLRSMFGVGQLAGAQAREHVAAQLAGVRRPDSDDAQILFDLLGLADGQTAPPRVPAESRRRGLVDLITEVIRARPQPMVFVLEDAHWIDADSDDTLADFTAALHATESVFVTSYRPEYRGVLRDRASAVITLEPLALPMAEALVDQLIGRDSSLAGLPERIAQTAGGNPLFVEEVVRDLADRGVLEGRRGDYQLIGGIAEIAVPATVHAVLAARIDRLPAQAKALLNAAAVIGSRFDLDMLQALLPEVELRHLADLVTAELIDQTDFVARQRYCFRHPLVRTVAYESQLTATRARAHKRLADAIEARDPGAADKNAGLIATHLEAAGEHAEAYGWRLRAAEWLRRRDLHATRDTSAAISATDLEVRTGAYTLLSAAGPALQVHFGDRIALVGENGAGKTMIMRVLAGAAHPYSGTVTQNGEICYLPQDPKEVDPNTLARNRVLSARGMDRLLADLEKQRAMMAEAADDIARDRAVGRYGQLEEQFASVGGYAAESEALRICANLGLPEHVLDRALRTLSAGERRRVEIARVLFAASKTGAAHETTLLLDEPTNHLDADSLRWLRDFLKAHACGLVVISHDVDLLAEVVNRVWFLDAMRGEVDVYNMTWRKYLHARAADEKYRFRDRASTERKAAALRTQAANIMRARRAKRVKAVAVHNLLRRADRMIAALDGELAVGKVAQAPVVFPTPAACGRTPLAAEGLTKTFGSHDVFNGVDLSIERGSRVVVLGRNGAGKSTLLRLLAGAQTPDAGWVERGKGLQIGYLAQDNETLDSAATVWDHIRCAATDAPEQDLRRLLRALMFSRPQLAQRVGTLSGGERTRLELAGLMASAANVLLLDEPTNNLDPTSREQVLDALRSYVGAVVLVTRDPMVADALQPQRVVLLPDGTEDLWSDDYRNLIELA